MNKKTIRIAGWALGLSMAVAGIGVAVGANQKASIEARAGALTTDTFTLSDFAATGTSYAAFSISDQSDATYVGYSAKPSSPNSGFIQFNNFSSSKNRSIATSVSGGYIRSVSVTWGNANSKEFTVYVGNVAYSNSSAANTGTSAGTLSSSTTTLNITGDYQYVSLYPNGAIYPQSVSFTWEAITSSKHTLTYEAGEHGSYDGKTTNSFELLDEIGTQTVKDPAEVGITADDGYVFDSWNDGVKGYAIGSTFTMGTVNSTLTAQWVEGVALSYNGNGAAGGSTATTYVRSGGTQTVSSSGFTAPNGKQFKEWNTSADGKGTSYDPGDEIEDYSSPIELFAIWEKISSISFVAGTDTGSNSVTKGGITISMSTMDRNDNYRCYSGSAISVSSNVGNIESISFSFTSNSYNGGFETEYLAIGSDEWNSGNADGQARITQIIVTLESTEPSVSLIQSSSKSVTTLKGDSDSTVKVLVKNIETPVWTFTFDEDEENGKNASSYIDVSYSALVENVSTLTITSKAIGTTTLHINVSGTDCEDTIPVTVNAKPASMNAKIGGEVVASVEIQNNLSSYKQFTFDGLDTDDNVYEIAAADVTGVIVSGDDCVTISGTRVNAKSAGTCVVRYSLKVLPSVYTDIAVSVINDYNTSVNLITFNANLSDTQGEYLDISEVFASKVANTHFGSTGEIADEELRFSYNDEDYENASTASSFTYDFEHGESIDATHRRQTVYVYTTFTESRVASFSIAITQANNPLSAITLDTGDELDLQRNTTHQLVVSYTPNNTTDSRAVTYSIDEENSDQGHSITVSNSGLISAGNVVGKSAVVVVTSLANPEVSAEVIVTTTLENMVITADVPVTWAKQTSLTIGDKVAFVNETASSELNGISTGGTPIGTVAEYSNNNPAGTYLLTIEAGNGGAGYSFKTKNNTYLSWSSGNSLTTSETKNNASSWTISSNDSGSFKLANVGDNNRLLQYNSGSPRFACYTSAQAAFQVYKYDGGEQTIDVDDTLFNLVNSHMSTYLDDKSVEHLGIDICDFSGSALNKSAWDAIGAEFNSSIISTYKLNYARANAEGNEVEKFLSSYDYVVGKYGSDYDFLGRIETGKIVEPSLASIPFSTINPLNDNASLVLTVTLTIGAAVAGGLLITRKRRSED